MRYLFKILTLLYFAFAFRLAIAQNFPVRVTPILSPPYTPFLTDYFEAGSDKLTLQVVLNDITVPEYRCKLRLTIEGVNISITTNPDFAPLPLVLSGGVPEMLYGSDISEYFKNTNLIFKGITQQEFEKKGNQLPEGIYRFSFEILDYNRGTVVSNKGNATAWMLLNDPPFVNLPPNNAKLKPINPQNIVFQWTPRHRGSPNAAFTTEYDVKLVEIWPRGRNPYDAINTSLPIFEMTTENTMVVYGPAETALVLGREYALQIRARDTAGKDLFKNNGYSEVIRFVYGEECPMPSGILADEIGTARARIRWQGNGQNSGYVLRYREKKDGAEWFEENTDQAFFTTTGMRPGTSYEYQLCGECESFRSGYTKEQTLTTLAENPNAFVCGNPDALVPIDGSGPLPVLMSNDFIKAGGFDVVVTHATGSNGKFSGDGLATVPWFNGAKVRVTFENISVNKSYQLTSGFINSRWNKDSNLLLTDEHKLTETNAPSSQFKSDVQTFEADTTVLIKGTMIASVFADSDGNIVVQTTDGGAMTLEKGKLYAVADEVGTGYLVDKDGQVTKTTATDAMAAGQKGSREYSNDPNASVRFAKSIEIGKETKFGFDEKRDGTLPQNYQQTENGKWVAWKALSTGQQDFVQAIAESTTDLNKIRFQLEGLSPQVINPTGQSLALTGKSNGTIEELLAYYSQQDTSKQALVAGKLNLVSYESNLSKKLVLISVNNTQPNFNVTSLGLELNKIYSQAVVSWEVNNTIQMLKVGGINENSLDDGGSGLLSNYTSEMKQVLNAYLNGSQLADNTYYLFIVSNAKSGSKLGYMPRSKQAGFIFLNPHKSETEIIHTIAHELGHGVFRLRHTFSEEEFIATQGTTDNLMDYAGGTALNKYQWDYVHNPEGVIGLFEEDEEGAMSEYLLDKTLKDIRYSYRTNLDLIVKSSPISRPNKIFGSIKLEDGKVYNNLLIERHWNQNQYSGVTFIIGAVSIQSASDDAIIQIKDMSGEIKLLISIVNQSKTKKEEINSLFKYLFPPKPKNLLLFVNGYRNRIDTDDDFPDSENGISRDIDIMRYWDGIDELFKERIGGKSENSLALYADGHHRITTSNHVKNNNVADSKLYFAASLLSSENARIPSIVSNGVAVKNPCYEEPTCVTLHTTPNVIGFNQRRSNGIIAGRKMVSQLKSGELLIGRDENGNATGVIDIVAHSMGYAYALGIVDEIKGAGFKLGRFYIIAPENACSGEIELSAFEEVWQYGSNEKEPQLWEQDGIAPQCGVVGLPPNPPPGASVGRIYIPTGHRSRSFLGAHSIENYDWIFTTRTIGLPGYVKERK